MDGENGIPKRTRSYNFLDLASEQARSGIEKDLKDILDTCPDEKREEFSRNVKGFRQLFHRFISEDSKKIQWGNILPPPENLIRPYHSLAAPKEINGLLDKLVVLKLNGGLGTTMGCTGPKSVITVRDEYTFLDMQVQQIEHLNNTYGCKIPLVLMNSFSSQDDIQKVLRKYVHRNVPIHSFQQSQYPKFYNESFRTVSRSVTIGEENSNSWYPPGHGDLYQSFYNSGLLQKFINEGKEYLFVSNIDNLGATVDLTILSHLLDGTVKERSEFLMEVTDKTRADVKGGTLIKYEEKLRLLEMSQVPKDHIEDFKSVSKFKIFNTNNLWIQLPAMKRLVESDSLHMEIIANHKQLDSGEKIIQLETAIGAAIKYFNNSIGINVPRSRFLPVKTCSDLFLVSSNLYDVKDGTLSMNPKRQFPSTPLVQLGNCFKKVKDFNRRLDGIPDIIELDHLTVAGDVTFGRGVVFKGTVIIIANQGERIDIPPGSILENKIISGNLRIMNH